MIKLYAGWVYRSGLQEFLATDSSQAETPLPVRSKCVIGIFEGRAAADVMPGESWNSVVLGK